MQRRTFLRSLLAALVSYLVPAFGRQGAAVAADGRFRHGVASGDPTAHAVIIWTRVSGYPDETARIAVRWQVAEDAGLGKVVAEGIVKTDSASDFTVKADATGLAPGRTFFYRFDVDGQHSPVGRTRTLPVGKAEKAAFAVVSCANYPAGYFHVYREIAERDDLDAVVHLGDYLYEYGMGEYATEHAGELDRVPQPVHECLTLRDYRRRHAQYKGDADSRAMHAAHPMIAVWDDHEIANDTWKGGAQNHQPDEGSWRARRNAAVQAWFEWMPVRGKTGDPIFRDFRYGDLAHLIMLDTRLYGRDAQPNVGDQVTPESVRAALEDPGRRLLGGRQERWLRDGLKKGGTVWQILGQQVKVAEMRSPDLEPLIDLAAPSSYTPEQLQDMIARSKDHPASFLDTWDGYPVARDDLLRDLSQYAANPVVLSGDLHAALAGELALKDGARPVAVEFLTTAVSSPGITHGLPEKSPHALERATLRQNPGLKFLDLDHRGWLCLTVTAQRCMADWHAVEGLQQREYRASLVASLWVDAGNIGAGLQGTKPGSDMAATA